MNNDSNNNTPYSDLPKPVFDHEKLDVYQFELKFISWVTELFEEIAGKGVKKTGEVCDQLDRASLSALLNTAEGNGKRQRQIRAKFFDDARGSATECAACLDALVAKKVVTEARIVEGKKILIRIVSMLCGLVDRFDSAAGQLRDDGVEYHADALENYSRTRTRRKK
jgi:four helix bundle protein